MASSQQTWRTQIRFWKNDLLQTYLRYRLYQPADPFKVALRQPPYRVVWILSHMRSGSSLLSHILIANPEVAGFGETHICYESLDDLKSLLFKVYWQGQDYRKWGDLRKLALTETYVLDKLLHNNKLVNTSLLRSENIFVIFLVREPGRSLNSIRDLKPSWSEEKTLSHYSSRLKELISYTEFIDSKDRALFITHDQLLNQSTQVFEALQRLLGTETGFSEKYQILKTTGAKHVGDPRGNIMAGQIVRTPRELKQTVSQPSIDMAREDFQACCNLISAHCSTINVSAKVSS